MEGSNLSEHSSSIPAGDSNSAIFLPVSVIIAALIVSATVFVVGADLGGKVSGLETAITTLGSGSGQGNTAENGDTTGNTGGTAEPTPAPVIDMQALLDDDAVEGSANAPVTIIEFSDFQCPFCSSFYNSALTQIRKDYVETGKVKIIYRDFPLSFHPEAQKAAEAAECAKDQGKFWEMHDKLFENQQTLSLSNYKAWAKELGLDSAKFNQCLDSGSKAAEVANDQQDGAAAGVGGTPSFFINGKLVVGAQPYSVFMQAIDAG